MIAPLCIGVILVGMEILADIVVEMDGWGLMEWLEAFSYVSFIVGTPMAIWIFVLERRKDRFTEEEEIYQKLSDEYAGFLRLVSENADLRLFSGKGALGPLGPEQEERRLVLFEMLVALFERAYILVYQDRMSPPQQRLWSSWEDYMRQWCRREDFRKMLPALLEGEDPDFVAHINGIAKEEKEGVGARIQGA